MRKFSLLIVLVGLILLPLCADATPKDQKTKTNEGTFSEQQIMLNNLATEALQNGEYAKAERIFVAMLAIGEFDVVWFNLARTYALQDKCLEAEEAFSQVMKARQLKGYREQLDQVFPRYVDELKGQCNAQVRLECTPAEMRISIDGGVDRKCSPDVIYNLVPGQHVFIGIVESSSSGSPGINSIIVTARANELVTGSLVVEDEEKYNRREYAGREAKMAKEQQNIIAR